MLPNVAWVLTPGIKDMKRGTDTKDYYTDTYTHRPFLGYRRNWDIAYLSKLKCIVSYRYFSA